MERFPVEFQTFSSTLVSVPDPHFMYVCEETRRCVHSDEVINDPNQQVAVIKICKGRTEDSKVVHLNKNITRLKVDGQFSLQTLYERGNTLEY